MNDQPTTRESDSSPAGTLEVRVQVRRGRFSLEVDVEVPGEGVTGLFGPSGSGKSSLLRCLAGLDPDASGRIRFGNESWLD